jgi:hypothetical protein
MNQKRFTIGQMVEDFESYPKQIRALIAAKQIPTEVIGKRMTVVDRAGYEAVRAAVEEFRNRTVLARAGRKPVATARSRRPRRKRARPLASA